jgi:hypothetical protein
MNKQNLIGGVVMKKMLKIGSLLIIFFLMVSSFALASLKISPEMVSESASMMLIGILLMNLGGFLRGAVSKQEC